MDWVRLCDLSVVGSAILLCLCGVVLSFLTLSGTWLVLLAALVGLLHSGPEPTWFTVLSFLGVSVVVEVFEAGSAAIVVAGHGGSRLGGIAGMAGGILGMVLGSIFVPIPLVGGVLGMFLCGFGCVFGVERLTGKANGAAYRAALGAVKGRIYALLTKVLATLAMSFWLLKGLWFG